MRSARGSICSRVWWAPRKPFVRWRTGLTNILCAGTDGPAAPPRRISGARTPDRSRRSEDVSTHRDARPGGDRREGARHCYAQPRDRGSRVARRRGGGSRDWRLRKCFLSLHQRAGIERDGYLARKYPSFGNLAPRDIASRAAKEVCDEGRGVGETDLGVYLDFADAINRLGADKIRERYGNLFDMYEKITGEN